MARKPDIKGDRDNWGEVLNEYLDTKAAVSDVTALTPGPRMVTAGGPIAPVNVEHSIYLRAYGPELALDGSEDWTEALNAALSDWYATGGGTIVFPPGVLLINGHIDIPNNGAEPAASQPSGKWQGQGAWASGRNAPPVGGTILEMRYSGDEVAKILTRGQGSLEITGITFRDLGGDDVPFIRTTGTTLWVHHNAFWGSKIGVNANQDCIILGGTNAPVGDADPTPNAPFQGYGTVIEANYFDRIRRGVFGQTYANAVVIQNNTAMHQCGSNIGADAAFIEFYPTDQVCAGNVVTGNLIEMVGYTVGIRAKRSERNTFAYNNFYDEGAQVASHYYFDEGAKQNLVIEGFGNDSFDTIQEHALSKRTNTVITSHSNKPTVFTEPVVMASGTGAATVEGMLVSQGVNTSPAFRAVPKETTADTWRPFEARRGPSHAYPDTVIWGVQQRGNVLIRGPHAGHVIYQAEDGTNLVEWTANGKRWAAAGAGSQFTIDSGSGGSYLLLRNYGLKLQDHTGGNEVFIRNGEGSPEGMYAAPVGSLYVRTDGGAGETLYVKESGSGSTGWVAK